MCCTSSWILLFSWHICPLSRFDSGLVLANYAGKVSLFFHLKGMIQHFSASVGGHQSCISWKFSVSKTEIILCTHVPHLTIFTVFHCFCWLLNTFCLWYIGLLYIHLLSFPIFGINNLPLGSKILPIRQSVPPVKSFNASIGFVCLTYMQNS